MVGAPYEDNSDAVYLYFGRRGNEELEFVRISGAPQSRFPSAVSRRRAGFGHSVIGDVDLDGNGTPGRPKQLLQQSLSLCTLKFATSSLSTDFAIGNPLDQAVSIYSTRSQLRANVSLTFLNSNGATDTLGQSDTSFSIIFIVAISFIQPQLHRKRFPSELPPSNSTTHGFRTVFTMVMDDVCFVSEIWAKLEMDDKRFEFLNRNEFPVNFVHNSVPLPEKLEVRRLEVIQEKAGAEFPLNIGRPFKNDYCCALEFGYGRR